MIGSRLKILRAHIGCTQETMASALCVLPEAYGRFERGTRDIGAKEIEMLKLWGVHVMFLFGETADPFAVSKEEFMLRFNDAVSRGK